MKKNIKKILYFFLIFYTISLFLREINGDEGIIAEHSYWFAKTGIVQSDMFTGLGLDWETRQFHYHKLYVILGAISIHFFDVSLFVLRSISLASALLFFILYYFYIKKNNKVDYSNLFLIALILFLVQTHFFIYSFLFRPEIMLMFLIFSIFFLIEIGNEKQNLLIIVLSGIAAGFAVLTHLNGLIGIIAGGALLLFQKKYFFAISFLVAAILVSAIYFFDISSLTDFQQFLYQFRNDPNFSEQHFLWYSPICRLIEEYKRFFHSPKEISLSLLFIVSLVISFKKLWKDNRPLIIYLFALIFCLAIITHGKTDKYLIIFLPFIFYIISYTFLYSFNIVKFKRIILYILISLFILINFITNLNSLILYNPIQRNREIAENMEINSNVFARETFFFNEIEHFNIHIPMAYELKVGRSKIEQNKEGFFAFAEKNQDKYIAIENNQINKHILKLIGWDSLFENKEMFGYRVKKKTNEYVVFEKVN